MNLRARRNTSPEVLLWRGKWRFEEGEKQSRKKTYFMIPHRDESLDFHSEVMVINSMYKPHSYPGGDTACL